MNRSTQEWEQEIINVLRGTSPEEPITVRDIADIIGMNDGPSCPRTRKYILSAMKNNNVAIGSNRKGYYLIRTAKQCQEYLNELLGRSVALSERIKITWYAFNGRN
jgi:hypothetical protein